IHTTCIDWFWRDFITLSRLFIPTSVVHTLLLPFVTAIRSDRVHLNGRHEGMKRIIVAMIAICALAVAAAPAMAQQTTGNIQGRIIDAQKAAVPGVTVTAKSTATGFTRSEVTDAEGVYRLNALPVGTYDVHAELSGFAPYDRKDVVVNIGQ